MKKIFLSTSLLLVLAIPMLSFFMAMRPLPSQEPVEVEIELGSPMLVIANKLEEAGIIRSALAFRVYAKINSISDFQAGSYKLPPSMPYSQIAVELTKGTVSSEQLRITFIDGKNMRWIAKKIASETNNSQEDVFSLLENRQYIEGLIEEYWFLTDIILEEGIYYPLEGYLFPDTYFFKSAEVSVEEILAAMLNRMGDILDKNYEAINKSEFGIHEILTLASTVNCEASSPDAFEGVASVFYNRLNLSMSLGSDVTTYYAVKVDMAERDLKQSEISKANPYNTRGPNMIGKLPVGPISSPCEKAIIASCSPGGSEYLFFVSDKNGDMYFAKTNSEHSKIISDLKSSGLWYEY
ncbi:MAG: endolytic transglycosylase MltG [Eubacteriaceae bacterium]|nr:endolytic transglycosylase MltG [Eubacteriaceae bacterium]